MSISTSRNGLAPRIWAREQARRIRQDSTGDWWRELVGVIENDVPAAFHDPLQQWEARAELFRLFRLTERAYDQMRRRVDGAKLDLSPMYVPVLSQVTKQIRWTVADVLSAEQEEDQHLPLLGTTVGYFFRGRSHLLSAKPKTGKTELVWQTALHWRDEKVLFITEEPIGEIQARLRRLRVEPEEGEHVTIIPALQAGLTPEQILREMEDASCTVLVLDTIRFLMRIEDETDNAEVAQAMSSLLRAAGGRTLLILHHARQETSGDVVDQPAGGLAFSGGVDVSLVLSHHQHSESRLLLRGVRRNGRIEPLLLEWRDGRLVAEGEADAVSFAELAERIRDVMADGVWRRKSEILQALAEPKPSDTHLRQVLTALVEQGELERDPAEERKGATYRYRLAGTKPVTKAYYGDKSGLTASNTGTADLFSGDDPFADMRGRCQRCNVRDSMTGSLYCAPCAREVYHE